MTVFRWAPRNSFVAQIDQLFELEADAKRLGYSLEQRLELRRRRSVLILESIRAQIQTARQNALPKSSLAKACDYTLTLWNRLIRFLDHPVLLHLTRRCLLTFESMPPSLASGAHPMQDGVK
jgi:hypothetical protein